MKERGGEKMTLKMFIRNAYAVLLAVLCAAGGVVVLFYSSNAAFTSGLLPCVFGLLAGVALAPFFHEAGHVILAKACGFYVAYCKVFVFEYNAMKEKKRFALCSPFSAEQTQAAPKYAEKRAGEMKKRAALYTAGGLIFGGVFLLVTAIFAAVFTAVSENASSGAAKGVSCFFAGALPYAAYLFFLNVVPFSYSGGKTDMRVLLDILKQTPCGVRFVAALNAQGRIAEGKAYSEIDGEYLYNLPVIAEDEPLFIMDLFFRYFAAAEKGDWRAAAETINRIASLAPYLTPQEEKSALCELVYMNCVTGDTVQAEKCYTALSAYGEFVTAAETRAAAAYSFLRKDAELYGDYVKRAEDAAQKEKLSGVRKSEALLLLQISGGNR